MHAARSVAVPATMTGTTIARTLGGTEVVAFTDLTRRSRASVQGRLYSRGSLDVLPHGAPSSPLPPRWSRYFGLPEAPVAVKGVKREAAQRCHDRPDADHQRDQLGIPLQHFFLQEH